MARKSTHEPAHELPAAEKKPPNPHISWNFFIVLPE
jgi:hypothetical protein